LTELRSYILLASYPALVIFVTDLFGPGLRWTKQNRSREVPESLRRRDESRGRVLLVFKYLLLLIVTAWLAGGFKCLYVSFASHRVSSWTSCFVGVLAGLFLLLVRRVAATTPLISQAEAIDYSLGGSTTIWLAIFLTAAIAEEPWRALCIRSFHYGPRLGNVATAACFSLAHLCGLPSRIMAGNGIIIFEVLVGLSLGATFMATGSVSSAFLASIVYYTGNYFRIRRRYLPTPGLGAS